MVIGPTPPGTGVIAPATSIASSKATSPSNLRVPSDCSTRSWPTSMTVAPGLSQLPRIISGRPTAATTMSGRRTAAGRSRVREWATVTVQLSWSSSCAIGLPTMFERPTTTASRPLRLAEFVPEQHQATERRARHQRLEPDREAARH